MRTTEFSLDPNGPNRLQIRSGGSRQPVEILLNGAPFGSIENGTTLEEGYDLTLPDNSRVTLKRAPAFWGTRVIVLRNGVRLASAASEGDKRLRQAAWVMWFIALMTLLNGIAVFSGAIAENRLAATAFLIMAVVFAVCGRFTRIGSLPALIVALVILGLDTIGSLPLVARLSGLGVAVWVLLRVFYFVVLGRAVSPCRRLRYHAPQPPRPVSMAT